MDQPDDTSLPFFSYGLFRPGQIGYSRIRTFVLAVEPDWTIMGELLERDGLPIVGQGDDPIPGWLIRFNPSRSAAAYSEINSVEPDRLYVWRVARVSRDGRAEEANVLFGRRPEKGSVHPEYRVWEGEKEPLFTTAITVIEQGQRTLTC
ncbi:hypothetical protein [Tautonia plasticadhaerens]|uniref:AIG2-like family protein n=1 Tax=Tautonia plasticadhaerens TaxID=2527974 RepID=A0A518H9Z7_9BACT|nr:hypothetical protein [Tautonia plasticadhaerens]QDV37680.1 hypothetical protein ElP_56230 [Tautonia plasticadhaerens]